MSTIKVPETIEMSGRLLDVICAAFLPRDTFTLPGFIIVARRGELERHPCLVTTLVINGDERYCTGSTYDLSYAQAFDLFAARCMTEARRMSTPTPTEIWERAHEGCKDCAREGR